jgi:hypothetical protein
MDPIEGSETSANINQTLGIHPKIETVNLLHLFLFNTLIAHLQYGSWCTKQSLQILKLKSAYEKLVLHPEQVWHCLLGQEKLQTASGSNKLDRVTAQFTTERQRRRQGNFRKLALTLKR